MTTVLLVLAAWFAGGAVVAVLLGRIIGRADAEARRSRSVS